MFNIYLRINNKYFSGVINRSKADWVTELTFYRWKKQFWGLMPTKFGRLRQLAGLSLDQDVLYEVIRKKP